MKDLILIQSEMGSSHPKIVCYRLKIGEEGRVQGVYGDEHVIWKDRMMVAGSKVGNKLG